MAEAVAFLGLACAAITAYHALYDLACKAHKKRKTKKERLLYDKARVDAAEKAFRNALKSGLKKAERVKEARRELLKGDETANTGMIRQIEDIIDIQKRFVEQTIDRCCDPLSADEYNRLTQDVKQWSQRTISIMKELYHRRSPNPEILRSIDEYCSSDVGGNSLSDSSTISRSNRKSKSSRKSNIENGIPSSENLGSGGSKGHRRGRSMNSGLSCDTSGGSLNTSNLKPSSPQPSTSIHRPCLDTRAHSHSCCTAHLSATQCCDRQFLKTAPVSPSTGYSESGPTSPASWNSDATIFTNHSCHSSRYSQIPSFENFQAPCTGGSSNGKTSDSYSQQQDFSTPGWDQPSATDFNQSPHLNQSASAPNAFTSSNIAPPFILNVANEQGETVNSIGSVVPPSNSQTHCQCQSKNNHQTNTHSATVESGYSHPGYPLPQEYPPQHSYASQSHQTSQPVQVPPMVHPPTRNAPLSSSSQCTSHHQQPMHAQHQKTQRYPPVQYPHTPPYGRQTSSSSVSPPSRPLPSSQSQPQHSQPYKQTYTAANHPHRASSSSFYRAPQEQFDLYSSQERLSYFPNLTHTSIEVNEDGTNYSFESPRGRTAATKSARTPVTGYYSDGEANPRVNSRSRSRPRRGRVFRPRSYHAATMEEPWTSGRYTYPQLRQSPDSRGDYDYLCSQLSKNEYAREALDEMGVEYRENRHYFHPFHNLGDDIKGKLKARSRMLRKSEQTHGGYSYPSQSSTMRSSILRSSTMSPEQGNLTDGDEYSDSRYYTPAPPMGSKPDSVRQYFKAHDDSDPSIHGRAAPYPRNSNFVKHRRGAAPFNNSSGGKSIDPSRHSIQQPSPSGKQIIHIVLP